MEKMKYLMLSVKYLMLSMKYLMLSVKYLMFSVKYWSNVAWKSPTIFKLVGPCEILSHGQKLVEKLVKMLGFVKIEFSNSVR